MTIIETLKHPESYYVITGMLVSMIYQFSRRLFRNYIKVFWVYSFISAITAILILGLYHLDIAIFLFVPMLSTILILTLEKAYLKKYGRKLPDTAFWYLTGEDKSTLNNNWNALIGITTFVLPMGLCLFTLIFIKS